MKKTNSGFIIKKAISKVRIDHMSNRRCTCIHPNRCNSGVAKKTQYRLSGKKISLSWAVTISNKNQESYAHHRAATVLLLHARPGFPGKQLSSTPLPHSWHRIGRKTDCIGLRNLYAEQRFGRHFLWPGPKRTSERSLLYDNNLLFDRRA